jgi:phosphatidylserine decarboxylase
VRIAPEGWVVIVPFALVCLVLPGLAGLVSPWLAGVLGLPALLLIFWALWFFRDPHREPPAGTGPDVVISPADGKVLKVDMAPLPKELRTGDADNQPLPRVSIFLNLLNVHVNRTPVAGKIEKIVYTPGKFFNASLDKASEFNERSAVLMSDPAGRKVAFSQIAGLVARRIVNHLREGQSVQRAERFGLIRFGSRAEIYFPPGSQISVKPGDITVAGVSTLGTLPPAR